jgi:hypothetical protein
MPNAFENRKFIREEFSKDRRKEVTNHAHSDGARRPSLELKLTGEA